jgi:tetratricopeptide (TPR) repeat protein
VHHAHRHGVLHRDLKPANILLDEQGQPHVTDFGLAKRVEEDRGLTQPGFLVGTPSYMAPEQACADVPLTTAVDIYGLGAILYELLTGQPPFQGPTPLATIEKVRSQDPVAPSRLQPRLPRDLETICLKALHKEPQRRYASAEEMAKDLDRYLCGEPIQARPVGIGERVSKWARRHPAGAALVAVSMLAVAALVSLGIWSYVRVSAAAEEARAKRDLAEKRFRQAREAADKLYMKVAVNWLADEPQKDPLQKEFLEEALQLYEEFTREESTDPGLRQEMGQALFHMAGIQRLLGQSGPSEQSYRRAIAVQTSLCGEFPERAVYQQQLAETWNWLGELYREGGKRLRDAEQAYGQAQEVQDRLVAPSSRAEYGRDLARTHYNLGIVKMDTGRQDEARAEYDRAVDLLRELIAEGHVDADSRHNLARCLINRGILFRESGQRDQAEANYGEAIELLRLLKDEAPNRPMYCLDLAVTCNNLGNLLGTEPLRRKEGLAAHDEALALARRLVTDFPTRPKYRKELANIHNSLGAAVYHADDPAEAREHWHEARRIYDRLLEEVPDSADYNGQRGMILANLGWLASEQQNWLEARSFFDEAVTALERSLKHNPDHPFYIRTLRGQHQNRAETCLHLGDHAGAAAAAETSLTVGRDPEPLVWYAAACYLARCAALAATDEALTAEQRRETAEPYAARALTLLGEAAARGMKDAERVKKDQATIFRAIQDREEFREIVAGMARRE